MTRIAAPFVLLLLLVGLTASTMAAESTPTIWPTLASTHIASPAPTPNTTIAPAAPQKNATAAPTAPSKNATVAPTPAPNHNNSTNHTMAPTMSLHTPAPTKTPTKAPTKAPAAAPSSPSPTAFPSTYEDSKQPHHVSFLRIIGKTIAWLIILFLGTVGFGFVMQHRYRILYFLKTCWYLFLNLPCTQWILVKLRLSRGGGNGGGVDSSLNTIIFDNEMSEGLLMRETDT